MTKTETIKIAMIRTKTIRTVMIKIEKKTDKQKTVLIRTVFYGILNGKYILFNFKGSLE